MILLTKLSGVGKSKGRAVAITGVAAVFVFGGASARGELMFTPGDLIVSRYGSTTSDLAHGAPTPISLIEFSPSGGAAILTDTLPTADGVAGSGNLGVVGQYASASEGNIQLSGNGEYLAIGGYSATAAAKGIQASTNAANGTNFAIGSPFSTSTIPLAQTTDTDVPRVVSVIDSSGNVNSSTELNDVYSTNNPRSVYSGDGSTFYISGQGDGNNADQGIFYGSTGLNTVTSPARPTGIYNSHDTRFVTAYNNNLYYSIDTSSGKFTGIWQFNGTPTGSATPTQIIPANSGTGGSREFFYSPDGFYFANPDTLYVADTGQPKVGGFSDGGIQKWTYNGSAWLLQYTLKTGNMIPSGNPHGATSGETGFTSITGEVVGTGANAEVELFAVSCTLGAEDPDGLYSITDALDATGGTGEFFSALESGPGNGAESFKGVAFAPVPVPEPASEGILGIGGVMLLGRRRRTRGD